MDIDTKIAAGCPIDRVLRLIWHEWTTHILWVLGKSGPTRFGALRRQIEGVSPKVLSARLRGMERDGLVYREHEASKPPRVTYGLTEDGKIVDAALRSLGVLAERWDGQRHRALVRRIATTGVDNG
ncbi:MAG: helix-turn-helix transcriptional regulator [Alphaproteobacteria bacterium]|nr:helix-turn-helix transcriptional regulator [Alphaproteobacteria bacterium]